MQIQKLVELLEEANRHGSYIACQADHLDDACKRSYGGWEPDGRGRPASEIQDGHMDRRRILNDMKERSTQLSRLSGQISAATIEIEKAFQLVELIRSIKT